MYKKRPKAFFFLFFLGFLLLTDQAIRSVYIPRDYHAFREYNVDFHHGFKANFEGVSLNAGIEFPFITNSLGLRDSHVRLVKKESKTHRVLLIGDSFTEGMGLPFEQTVAGHLNTYLDSSKFSVLVGAAASYSPKLSYLKLKALLERDKLSIDEVILLHDLSDLGDEYKYYEFEPRSINAYFRWGLTKIRKSLYYKSGLFYLTNNLFMRIRHPEIKGDDQQIEDFLQLYLQESTRNMHVPDFGVNDYELNGLLLAEINMLNIIALCEQHNIELSHSIHPWPDLIRKNELNPLFRSFWLKFSEENSLELFDFFEVFEKMKHPNSEIASKYYFEYDFHWNSNGCELVAQTIAKKLTSKEREIEE